MTPLALFLLIFAAVLGLVIGSFLNVVIYRVPAGIPLTRESRCPSCDAPVKPWQNVPVISWLVLRAKCANCGTRISARYPLVELATGVAFAGVAWMGIEQFELQSWTIGFAGPGATITPTEPWYVIPVTIAFLYLAAISIALAMIDLDTHRLPNAIVLPSYLVIGILLTAACLLGAPWTQLGQAAIGGATLYAFYYLLRLIKPAGMGGGDVKLAGVLGLALGWVGWGALIVGAFAAFLVGGVIGIALMLGRKATRKSAIPFGPWMLVGAWIGIVAGQPIAAWYLNLLSPN